MKKLIIIDAHSPSDFNDNECLSKLVSGLQEILPEKSCSLECKIVTSGGKRLKTYASFVSFSLACGAFKEQQIKKHDDLAAFLNKISQSTEGEKRNFICDSCHTIAFVHFEKFEISEIFERLGLNFIEQFLGEVRCYVSKS